MRKTTKTLVDNEAREALKRGSAQVYKPVGDSMGAAGKNSAFVEFNKPSVTNDGVTIARNIRPEDPFEAMGADLVRDAAEKTNDEAGDGTSTSILLAHSLIEHGLEEVSKGHNPMVLKRELFEAKDEVIALIKEASTEIKTKDELFDVARISVEDEKVAKIVTEARHKIGAHGIIIADEGPGLTIEKEELPGYFFESGLLSPYMITDPDSQQAILENPAVIVTDKYLNLNKELVGVLDQVIKNGYKSAIVIADNIQGELLQSIIINKLKGNFATIAVRRPPTIEELEDIACLTGSTAVTEAKGFKDIRLEHVGKARRVIVGKNKTIIIGEPFPAVDARIKNLDEEIKKTGDEPFKQVELKMRRAKLAGGIVVMRVGAKTETERKYLKRKVDDAIGATRAALEEGIVDGAGSTLHNISNKMKTETAGAKILAHVLKLPRAKILENAGIADDGKMYDVLTGKPVKDLRKAGIIDPAKVERCSVENAVSVASMVLTLASATVEIERGVDKDTITI